MQMRKGYSWLNQMVQFLPKKGSGWFSGNKSQENIQAGDVIVVPIDLQKGKWLETITSSLK